jgi:hypothetical protein
MWRMGYASLITSMIRERLGVEGFTPPDEKITALVSAFFAGAPMPDLSGPSLLVRKWLSDGMPEE